MEEREPLAPRSPSIVLLTQVVDIREAINWIAHGNFAGSSFGPRLLFEFSGTNEILENEGLEDLGREQLAFDLLWNRAESGDIKLYGKRAGLTGDAKKPESRYWDKPQNDPEPIPPEVLTSADWTEDDQGGIQAEEVSYWGIAVDHADLLTWCKRRSETPSLKRPGCPVAPE
ncbi:MAG: hypothetical protein EXQ95_10715 [Alphaproteobacteria bacterium]|nr:hypothetical protein [Alphaproteobacteria bacterium]